MPTPRARELGINAILSTPLMVQAQPFGALNMYSRTAFAFAAPEQELASVFATQASAVLARGGVGTREESLAAHLQEALRTRQVIAQAQGVVMERDRLSREEAHALLRRLSRSGDVALRDLATSIVASARAGPDAGLAAGREGDREGGP
ncbi:MAG: GAF and ANTAR domain-containing protein [Acidimicrobiales bacterium]